MESTRVWQKNRNVLKGSLILYGVGILFEFYILMIIGMIAVVYSVVVMQRYDQSNTYLSKSLMYTSLQFSTLIVAIIGIPLAMQFSFGEIVLLVIQCAGAFFGCAAYYYLFLASGIKKPLHQQIFTILIIIDFFTSPFSFISSQKIIIVTIIGYLIYVYDSRLFHHKPS